MVVELLDESQPWRVNLPNVDVYRGRNLEARDSEGVTRSRWPWLADQERWSSTLKFIVFVCMDEGWKLYSTPIKESPDA